MKLAYRAFDISGKAMAGEIDAPDSAGAIATLRSEGLFVTEINDSTGTKKPKRAAGKKVRQRMSRLAIFARQLQLLVSTGTPIVQALESLERQMADPGWQAMLSDVRRRVEDGASFAEALEAHPQYFDEVFCSLISAGESAGKLSPILERLATLTMNQLKVRQAIVGALVYPTLLISVAFAVLIMMLMVVLPKFKDLFVMLHVTLPPSTKVLISLSEFLRGWWWAVLLMMVAIGVGAKYWLATAAGRRAADTALLRVPKLGGLIRDFAAARMARMLAILMSSHLPLLDILDLVRRSMKNHHYVALVDATEDAVKRGDPISSAFDGTDLVSPSFVEAMRSGEQSGQVAVSLMSIADFLDDQNETIVKALTSILEPVILILLGLVVGFVAISMFMPLFDLAAAGG